MYARNVEHDGVEQELSFGVSGKLIMNVLVMYDRQTESYWSQLLGEAVEGPLAGAKLQPLAATQTTWGEWKRLHPDTKALFTNGMGLYDTYENYYRAGQQGVLGESRSDDRLPPKELIVGAVVEGQPVAYAHGQLAETPVVNDTVVGIPLLVVFKADTRTGLIFGREVAGRELTFEPTDDPLEIRDQETGSVWLILTGLALDGPLAGQSLERLPSTSSFWFGWKDWYPETHLYGR
ncbi:MAG: DUF3179 domain-containing protein [Caldilineaceae bacterium]|nr:DUF3179 domain-containing protein [Caldilineaceae bacterium]